MHDSLKITGLSPFVFLFDAAEYGPHFEEALANAILSLRPPDVADTCVLRGDCLFHNLAQEIERVVYSANPQKLSKTLRTNKKLLASLIWDLSEAIATTWNTVDEGSFPLWIASTNVFCLTTPTLSLKAAQAIDSALRAEQSYLGAIEFDRGNPVQEQLFIGFLLLDYFIRDGSLYCRKDFEGDGPDIYWAEEVPFISIEQLSFDDFNQLAPRPSSKIELSTRGRITQAIFKEKRSKNHLQKIASDLYSKTISNKSLPFTLSSGEKPGVIEAVVPREKLEEYALSPNHPDGKHKAKLFSKLLEIEKEDWRYLAAQLINGLDYASFANVRVTDHGIQYQTDMPVLGRNGVTKNVRTAWIILGDGAVRLATTYLSPEEIEVDENGNMPPIINQNLQGSEKWKALHKLANQEGELAAKNCTPTPMLISGYKEPELDGMCGGAYVIINDAVRGYGRWLRVSQIGTRHQPRGRRVWARVNSQSKERAEAYANAFARVLLFNGIKCSVESYHD
ncbi:MAG: hypothetical protein HZB44_03825 [Actinobacteria bacterium]|nr:hypothetical protein [Actinomycetota bacterium]